MRKFGIDGHILGDNSGGNETYYRNVIENFTKEQQKNIILFLNQDYDASELDFHGQIVRFKSHNAFVRNFIEIPHLMLKYKLAVMHMQYFIPFTRFCPVVTTIHDISFEHMNDIFTKKDYFLQKHLIPYAAKKSKTVFTVSEFSLKDIKDHYHIDPEKLVVTYDACTFYKKIEISQDEKNRIADKFGLPERFILSVGNLQPRKNIKRLLEAYDQLRKESGLDLKLVIVGKKAWMYDGIFDGIADSDSRDNIILTDYVTNEELRYLYNMAEIFVYPSLFEGFGLPVLEAMSCGVPVAASNVTAIPEVLQDAGVSFDPYDVNDIAKAIDQLVKNQELRSECITKGLLKAKNFSWRDTSEVIYQEYCKAAKKK